jgi:hypothetical protein
VHNTGKNKTREEKKTYQNLLIFSALMPAQSRSFLGALLMSAVCDIKINFLLLAIMGKR